MPLPAPEPGLVLCYDFLWRQQHEARAELGRKCRPKGGQHRYLQQTAGEAPPHLRRTMPKSASPTPSSAMLAGSGSGITSAVMNSLAVLLSGLNHHLVLLL